MSAGGRGLRTALAALAALALASVRPLACGARPLEVLAFAAFLAFYVLLPGSIVVRRFRPPADDVLDALGQAFAIGLALQAVVFVLLAIFGLQSAFVYAPLLMLPFLRRSARSPVIARARAAAEPVRALRKLEIVLLLVIVSAALTGSSYRSPSNWWTTYGSDASFHAGNVAELARHWPLVDPRLAGEPLNYHFFAYALPAGASLVLDRPVLEVVDRSMLGLMPALLALLLFIAGRRYGRSATAGLCAAAAIVLHSDLGETFVLWPGKDLRFSSPLGIGVFESTSTSFGLVLLASLAIVLHGWWSDAGRNGRSHAVLAALLGFVAAGAKGSVMPVVLGGIVLTWLAAVLRHRPVNRGVTAALFVLLAVALPMTWALAVGEQSYATSMFRLWPGLALRTSSFHEALAAACGFERFHAPGWFSLLVLPLWLMGYLGLAGLGALLFVMNTRRRWNTPETWCFATAASGLALALLLAASGLSELFFAYSGQIALAIVAGAGFASALAASGWRGLLTRIALLALAIPIVTSAIAARIFVLRSVPAHMAGPRVAALLDGLDWIRVNAPANVVLVLREAWLQASVRAERRVFHESENFSPAMYVQSEPDERGVWVRRADAEPPYALRAKLVAQLFEKPDAATIEAIRTLARASGPLWVLVDRARTSEPGSTEHVVVEPLGEEDLARFSEVGRVVFRNEALAVFELRAASSSR